jgi:hypothetical protein
MTPLTQDGTKYSLVCDVSPQMPCALHFAVSAMSGNQNMGIVENFSTSQAVNPNLTTKQQALVTAILALINGYGN